MTSLCDATAPPNVSRDDSAEGYVKTPVMMAHETLDFSRVIRAGETIGWAEATAEPVFLIRMLDAQAERCPPFRVFFALTFSDALAAGHANVIVTALGGASAGRPDEKGLYNAGFGIEHLHAAIGRARLAIVQVNPGTAVDQW